MTRGLLWRRVMFVEAEGERAVALGAIELHRSEIGYTLVAADALGIVARFPCGRGAVLDIAQGFLDAATRAEVA